EEGAKLVLTNTPLAIRMGDMDELAAKTGSQMIAADATSVTDLENLFSKSMEFFGGQIDFVLHSIG
ncbi:MAG TPA: enoyl-ACP reductase, partial [Bacteroidales bacterium]|nr:enoyl-ACP reductase [Bacteroidales bacterium]